MCVDDSQLSYHVLELIHKASIENYQRQVSCADVSGLAGKM